MQSRLQCSERPERFENQKLRAETWHPKVEAKKRCDLARIFRQQALKRWLAVLTVVAIIPFAAPIFANEETESPVSVDQMQTGSLLFRMQKGYVVATRMNTSIDARINGLVARVSVRQEFRNDGADWVEGTYVYPLPDKAAVDHLRMYIGDRFIEGEIREKAQAKKEYEAAKTAGKKASLVEQQRANIFTTSVANIAPGESVTIEIEYLETLQIDEGTFSLRIPMTITPRYIPGSAGTANPTDRQGSGWAANTTVVPDASKISPPMVARSRDHKTTFTADLNAGVPLEFISSRYHAVDVIDNGGRYHVGLVNGISPMDHDLELTWKPEPVSVPRAMMFTETVNGQPHALLMVLPPDDMSEQTQSLSRELVFVIDTSGSMQGTSLAQAKRSLGLAITGLNPGDKFNVVQFNSTTSALFPDSVSADAHNIGLARRFVTGLRADGGTEMAPAIDRALSGSQSGSHLRQIIFITDGSVGNEEQLFSLIEQKLGNSRLFTVGIGSAPNSWFMRKAAEAGRGTFTMISALHEVKEKMERLFRKIEQPQMTDIAIEWPGGTDVRSYPTIVPDLYSGEPIVVKARLASDARPGDAVKVGGNSMLGSWGAELPIQIAEPRSGIAALWARARIEDLLDRERRGAPADATRTAVLDTALTHHLVSKYTSLVAIDKTPVRAAGANLKREQVPGMMPYGQSPNAIFGFPATATSAGLYRLSGFILIALALLLLTLFARKPKHAALCR